MLNDPLNTGLFNTLDSLVSTDKCVSFDKAALFSNVLQFLFIWWAPHSLLARERVKKALGLYHSQYDRPIFAFVAPLCWLATLMLWRPINTCAVPVKFLDLPAWRLASHGIVFALASVVLLGLFYLL